MPTMKSEAMKKVMPAPIMADELKKKVDPSRVAVWERRLVNPGRSPSTPIALREDGVVTRWINTANEGRFHRAVYDQGWEPVRVDDLRDDPKLLGFQTQDGTVRRGHLGQEILMKMPEGVFRQLTRAKAKVEMDTLKKTRNALAQAAAQRYGGNAGDWAAGTDIDTSGAVSGLKGKILDSYESRVVESEEGDQG